MGKILRISLVSFTPNTLGRYGLIKAKYRERAGFVALCAMREGVRLSGGAALGQGGGWGEERGAGAQEGPVARPLTLSPTAALEQSA